MFKKQGEIFYFGMEGKTVLLEINVRLDTTQQCPVTATGALSTCYF